MPAHRIPPNDTLAATIAVLAGVAVQMGCTLLLPGQLWSMAAGQAFIVLCCGAVVLRSAPAASTDRWRWHGIALGLFFWALMFLAMGYEVNYHDERENFAKLFGGLKQACFIVVLVSSSDRENTLAFRAIDAIQSLILVLLFIVWVWGPSIGAASIIDVHHIPTGYVVMIALAVISYFSQEDSKSKSLVFNVVLLMTGYAIASMLAAYLNRRYNPQLNSPMWIVGDVIFVIYAIRSARLGKRRDRAIDGIALTGPASRRHLPPIFLSVLLLLLAFECSRMSPVFGAVLGIGGLLSYAARTTLLLDRYLAARDRLIAAERLHSRLLVDMIHEIRSPLCSMTINAAMLQRTATLPEQQAGWVEQIGVGGARVTAMLNGVLEIERIDAGLVHSVPRDCDVVAVVRSAIAIVTAQAAAAGIAIAADADAGPRALADPDMLERVVVNLLTNAVRFTRQGGRIAVTIDDGEPAFVAIRVRDDGVGIDADRLATLFDRFSHIGVPLRGHRGSGLGLSICHGLMTMMGGRIALDSRIGEGTTATVHVPRATAPRIAR